VWYFAEAPPAVPTDDCHRHAGKVLLYAGISPKAPPKNGKPPSKQNLQKRIQYHMNGNAEGSTLRLTLGVLLAPLLNIQLRRVGSGRRSTFSYGEEALSEWLDKNAYVAWIVHEMPWEIEPAFISAVSLPLNIDHNRSHPFCGTLRSARSEAKRIARELPIDDHK
jgi:hypothetical protein